MGAGASAYLQEASEEEVRGAVESLTPRDQAKLAKALALQVEVVQEAAPKDSTSTAYPGAQETEALEAVRKDLVEKIVEQKKLPDVQNDTPHAVIFSVNGFTDLPTSVTTACNKGFVKKMIGVNNQPISWGAFPWGIASKEFPPNLIARACNDACMAMLGALFWLLAKGIDDGRPVICFIFGTSVNGGYIVKKGSTIRMRLRQSWLYGKDVDGVIREDLSFKFDALAGNTYGGKSGHELVEGLRSLTKLKEDVKDISREVCWDSAETAHQSAKAIMERTESEHGRSLSKDQRIFLQRICDDKRMTASYNWPFLDRVPLGMILRDADSKTLIELGRASGGSGEYLNDTNYPTQSMEWRRRVSALVQGTIAACEQEMVAEDCRGGHVVLLGGDSLSLEGKLLNEDGVEQVCSPWTLKRRSSADISDAWKVWMPQGMDCSVTAHTLASMRSATSPTSQHVAPPDVAQLSVHMFGATLLACMKSGEIKQTDQTHFVIFQGPRGTTTPDKEIQLDIDEIERHKLRGKSIVAVDFGGKRLKIGTLDISSAGDLYEAAHLHNLRIFYV